MMFSASASTNNKNCLGPLNTARAKGTCVDNLDRRRKHPVVIYLHGCGGGTSQGQVFSEYAVTVSPNSLARKNRPVDCSVNSDKQYILGLRFDEVRYAMEQLRAMPWVNTEKIYLAGFSEGGATAALYAGQDRFAGRIILGWVCNSANFWWVGINGPKVPVLAVVGSEDEYHQSEDKRGTHCGQQFGDRPFSRSIIIPGAGHSILLDSETTDAIAEFIGQLNQL
jgi:dienelactone hydrolase